MTTDRDASRADQSVPSRVVLYANQPHPRVRAAVFTWSPERGVQLEVVDPKWGAVAEKRYNEGVLLDGENRLVRKEEGAAFMSALVQPTRMTYYSYVDESDADERGIE